MWYRPVWKRQRTSNWLWIGAAGLGLLLVVVGVFAWRFKASATAGALQKNPLMLDEPKVSVQALDFTAANLSGKNIKLADYRGSIVLLNFWATWCVPCMEEMPAMDRLTKALAGRKFKVLAVDLQETPEKVQDWAKTHHFGFDLLLDAAGEISSHYGVSRIPVTYVLDQRGYIIYRAVGPRAWDGDDSQIFFQELIQSPPALRLPSPAAAQAAPPPVPGG
jgi:peroxiredoxin